MNPDELKVWLASSYPFLASLANQARFVELVREEVEGGKKEAMARLVAVNRLAKENRMKFNLTQMVRHVKTGKEYMIVGTPQRYRIESTGEPAYAYTSSPVSEIWIRPQSEFEDGRFVSYQPGN